MTEETPATRHDPALSGEGGTNQLPKEDTLEQRGVEDLLDEGYSPPDRDPLRGVNLTEEETIAGESITERLDREEPEVWQEDQPPSPERQPDRSGRLEDIAETAPDREQDVIADDVGVAGGAATAEEAAMRVVTEDGADGLTDEGSTAG